LEEFWEEAMGTVREVQDMDMKALEDLLEDHLEVAMDQRVEVTADMITMLNQLEVIMIPVSMDRSAVVILEDQAMISEVGMDLILAMDLLMVLMLAIQVLMQDQLMEVVMTLDTALVDLVTEVDLILDTALEVMEVDLTLDTALVDLVTEVDLILDTALVDLVTEVDLTLDTALEVTEVDSILDTALVDLVTEVMILDTALEVTMPANLLEDMITMHSQSEEEEVPMDRLSVDILALEVALMAGKSQRELMALTIITVLIVIQ
jgi:hypothetical protein